VDPKIRVWVVFGKGPKLGRGRAQRFFVLGAERLEHDQSTLEARGELLPHQRGSSDVKSR